MRNFEEPKETEFLPEGKTCIDCKFFKSHCEWLLSRIGTEIDCDWTPSRYKEKSKDDIE